MLIHQVINLQQVSSDRFTKKNIQSGRSFLWWFHLWDSRHWKKFLFNKLNSFFTFSKSSSWGSSFAVWLKFRGFFKVWLVLVLFSFTKFVIRDISDKSDFICCELILADSLKSDTATWTSISLTVIVETINTMILMK